MSENNGSISYTLSIPTGTDHKKYIVVNDNYWEVEFRPAANGEQAVAGELALKKRYSTQSDFFFNKTDTFFNFGFGTRWIVEERKETWNHTLLVLINV